MIENKAAYPFRQPLKILVISSTYPRSDSDYAVAWMRESHRQLIKRGHRVVVLAPSYQGLNSHVIDDIPVIRFRYAPRKWEKLTHEEGAPNKIHHPLMQCLAVPYILSGYRSAARLAKQEQFDIVHTHWPFPHTPMGMAAAKACHAPLVLMSHGAEFAIARRKSWVQNALQHSLRQGDLLIANSSDTASQIKNMSGRDAIILPYGSTVKPKSIKSPCNERPRILFTGRLIQRKGVKYLLRATARILRHQKIDVVITGDGDQREILERECRNLQLKDCVKFVGFVSNKQLNEEYARCDVWVNPSIIDDNGDTEGLGVGSIEAYAHRKPVVASAVGGIPDTVKHGKTGLLVPAMDEKSLARAILDLINNPKKARQFGEEGLRFAQEKFNWDHITDQLEDAYYRLLEPSNVQRNETSNSQVA